MGRAGDFDRHEREVVECQGRNNGAEEDEQLARQCRWKGQGGVVRGALGRICVVLGMHMTVRVGRVPVLLISGGTDSERWI